jgi:hypothetical protein
MQQGRYFFLGNEESRIKSQEPRAKNQEPRYKTKEQRTKTNPIPQTQHSNSLQLVACSL